MPTRPRCSKIIQQKIYDVQRRFVAMLTNVNIVVDIHAVSDYN